MLSVLGTSGQLQRGGRVTLVEHFTPFGVVREVTETTDGRSHCKGSCKDHECSDKE